MPEVTVLVNTWNRAASLPLVLAGYGRQTVDDFEVVIADDGSEDGTDALLRRLRRDLSYPLRHVRHPRRGHRRAAILNRGVREARGRTILFTDADSIPRRDLVEVHLRRRERNRILVGGYLRLTEAQSALLDVASVAKGDHEEHLTEEALWRLRLEHAKIRMYLALRRARRPHNMGLNYSAWKGDLEAINGYDEIYEGWGKADGDVRDRLRILGVEPKSLWAEAIVFHLWHEPHPTKYDYLFGRTTRNAVWARRPGRPARCLRGLERLPGWREQTRELEVLVEEAVNRGEGAAG